MVKLTRIYTRGGDKGRTSLADGKRVPKHHLRVSAYGEVDEAGAALGLARLHASAYEATLSRIQNDLFDLGADLATPERDKPKHPPLRIQPQQHRWLEGEIDRYNGELQPLQSFVLAGGSAAAAHLHLARTVVRRAERAATALAAKEKVNQDAVIYLNRLSDLLFVLARHANDRGLADVLWKPGQNR